MSFLSTPTVCYRKQIYIYLKNNIITLHRLSFYSHYVSQKKKDRWGYLSQLHEFSNLCHPGQETLVDLQGLLAFTLLHFEEFLYTQKQEVCWLTNTLSIFFDYHRWSEIILQSIHFKWTTNLIGWWSHHCRMQTVSPSPWREAEMQHWWSHCSAPWDEPERRQDRDK